MLIQCIEIELNWNEFWAIFISMHWNWIGIEMSGLGHELNWIGIEITVSNEELNWIGIEIIVSNEELNWIWIEIMLSDEEWSGIEMKFSFDFNSAFQFTSRCLWFQIIPPVTSTLPPFWILIHFQVFTQETHIKNLASIKMVPYNDHPCLAQH